MDSVNNLRSLLIDKIMAIQNRDILEAVEELLNKSKQTTEKIPLSEDQKVMIQMSLADVENNLVIEQDLMDEADFKWLENQ